MFCPLYDKGVVHISFPQAIWALCSSKALDSKSSTYNLVTIGLTGDTMVAPVSAHRIVPGIRNLCCVDRTETLV